MGIRTGKRKFRRKNQENIRMLFEEKTGVQLAAKESAGNGMRSMKQSIIPGRGVMRAVTALGTVFCLLALSAFAYGKFSSLAGDEVSFRSVYKGEGIVEITVKNNSDKKLVLQEKLKLMNWKTGEVQGDASEVIFGDRQVNPYSEKTISIDLSQGYDIGFLEEPIPAGEWYYLVLTNNNFAFGQDWMCDVDFQEGQVYSVANSVKDAHEPVYETGRLKFEEWTWPTVSEKLSAPYGVQQNGVFSDHINIAGNEGDDIYAVSEGVILQSGFEKSDGNFILLELGDGITVKYGHLKKMQVSAGDHVEQGQQIGEMGKTGMATGVNLSFAVYQDGEAMNPLAEE